MTAIALMVGALLGAASFRARGGWFGDLWKWPGQVSRLAYSVVMAALVFVPGHPWPVGDWRSPAFAALLVGAWFAGAVAFGTFRSIDAGRNADGSGGRVRDFVANTVRGTLYALPPAALVAGVCAGFGEPGRAWSAAFLLLGGAMQGLCYEMAHRLRPMPRHPATVYAEFATGACMGLGAVAAAVS